MMTARSAGPQRRARRHPLREATLIGVAVVGFLAVLSGGGTAQAVDGGDNDYNITVQVAPGQTAGGSGSSSAGAPAGASRATTTQTQTTVDASTVVTGSITPPAPAADEFSIGGILYVSGLTTAYSPSIDPLAGDLAVQYTVRNVSGETIDSTSRFWVTNAFGAELSAVDPVEVTALKPGESRVVSATLTGVGQWTFATAHMTLTPPTTVAGEELQPLTRDAFVVLPPWFLLALLAIGGVAYAVVRIVRAGSVSGLAVEPAAGSTA
ncbi:MAG: hypothetical protein EPO52_14725 [Herbiconiux sp.]|uniref:hypothetical protein n=1 Tax=Herbiconiux sp. TaxID=1871186 RepID=UPI00120A6A2A|nr:hypothetical protein [Herbiconiux sp.]TAJ46794.1 MAG: hypothetical protein EPO52_14725 [Herbiconiux sp.]